MPQEKQTKTNEVLITLGLFVSVIVLVSARGEHTSNKNTNTTTLPTQETQTPASQLNKAPSQYTSGEK